MGIAPITNLIPLSTSRAAAPALEPLPMARVENSARTGDETYSPSHGQSGDDAKEGSQEEDQELLAASELSEDGSAAGSESRSSTPPDASESKVNFFA